jgi:hypothetical protein
MAIYTITLSEAEDKALGFVAFSQEQWINNSIHERCRLAIEEIVKFEMERMFEAGEQIPSSKDEIVLQANIKSAAEREAESTIYQESQ